MGGKTQKVTNTTKLPSWLESAYQSLIPQAQQVAQTPYNPATEQQVAGLTAPQTQAFEQVQNTLGIQSPYIGQAGNMITGASGPISSSAISNYLNPYQNDVINATMAQINQNNAVQQNQLKGNAVAQGALGGDRIGVAQAQLAGQQALATNQTLASLNQSNYNQALAAAQADQTRALQGAGMYAGLGSQAQQANSADIAALLNIGGLQQGQQQNVLNAATANAQQQQQYPFQTTQWLAQLESGLAPSAGGTTTQSQPGPSPISQVAGLGLTAAALFSDKRLKEDIEPVGKTFDGQTIYKYRYKGEPQTQIGLMAQDVERHHPDAVGSAGGFKTVDYDRATDAAARRGHFADGGWSSSPSIGIGMPGNPHPRLDELLSKVHHAAKGIRAIHAASGGGIGMPQGYAYGGFPDDDDDANTIDADYEPVLTDQAAINATPVTSASGWQGLGVPREQLPAGMRNNNPGNIKYVKGLNYPGLTGPSTNLDEGDPQMVFDTPAHGMQAAASLAARKYAGGMRTPRQIIAGNMGWTPGNESAAANIAHTMGIGPDDDLGLGDPARMETFLHALTLQEHGPSSKLYGNDLYHSAATGVPVVSGGDQTARAPMVADAVRNASQPAGIGAAATAEEPSFLDRLSANAERNLPLLAAGLGMLASRSPFAGAAIGEGGLQGVQALMKQRAIDRQANALRQQMLIAQQRMGIQNEALSERKRHNQAIEGKAGQPAFSKNVIWGVGPNGEPALLQPGTTGEAIATKLPEGYKVAKEPIKMDAGTKFVLMDPQTRQVIGEIPKNVEETAHAKAAGEESGKQEAQAKIALPQVQDTTQRILTIVDKLDKDPMRQWFTGYSGYLPNMSPEANTYQSYLDQIKGNLFLQAFNNLRGGGQITEVEGKKATDALTRLSTIAPSDKGYQDALDDTKKVMREILNNARKRAGMGDLDKNGAPAAKAAPQVGTVEKGYRFKGGDPADANSWEKVNP